MNKKRVDLRLFETDANVIDRSGAEALIPTQEANEIIQGTIAQSAVLSRGRKLANMTSKQYKMPVLDMLPIAYFVNGDNGAKKIRRADAAPAKRRYYVRNDIKQSHKQTVKQNADLHHSAPSLTSVMM